MKKIFIPVVLFSLLVLFGCNKNSSEINKNESQPGTKSNNSAVENANSANTAPAFTLESPGGKKVSLADYKGKVVIVDFWATWCPPCRRGIPDLIELQSEFGGKIAVIGISVDTDTRSQVEAFAKSMKINYDVVYATPDVVQSYGNIESIPTSFIIDKNGKIVNQFVGLTPKETYVSEIKKLVD